MKFTSIFFTASASIFEVYLKDTYKRARNMKFTSIFFTASASIFEVYLKDTYIFSILEKTSYLRTRFIKFFWNFE